MGKQRILSRTAALCTAKGRSGSRPAKTNGKRPLPRNPSMPAAATRKPLPSRSCGGLCSRRWCWQATSTAWFSPAQLQARLRAVFYQRVFQIIFCRAVSWFHIIYYPYTDNRPLCGAEPPGSAHLWGNRIYGGKETVSAEDPPAAQAPLPVPAAYGMACLFLPAGCRFPLQHPDGLPVNFSPSTVCSPISSLISWPFPNGRKKRFLKSRRGIGNAPRRTAHRPDWKNWWKMALELGGKRKLKTKNPLGSPLRVFYVNKNSFICQFIKGCLGVAMIQHLLDQRNRAGASGDPESPPAVPAPFFPPHGKNNARSTPDWCSSRAKAWVWDPTRPPCSKAMRKSSTACWVLPGSSVYFVRNSPLPFGCSQPSSCKESSTPLTTVWISLSENPERLIFQPSS